MDEFFDAETQKSQWDAQVLSPGTLIEAECYDDNRRPQGRAVYLISEQFKISPTGAFARAQCLGASDGY